jgi:hypothetical protein
LSGSAINRSAGAGSRWRMFDSSSRYYHLPTYVYDTEGDEHIPYKARRFLPLAEELPLLSETRTVQNDRLDLIAARTLGDPLLYWEICDASTAMNPVDLLVPPGRKLSVPLPYPQQIQSNFPVPLIKNGS